MDDLKLKPEHQVKFDENCIHYLNELLSSFIRLKITRIRNTHNLRYMGWIIKQISSRGFIRTHAFLSNWLLDFITQGEMHPKTLHDIVEELPWNWDKSSEYLQSLEKEKIVTFSRNSKGLKMCSINSDLLVFNKNREVNQLANLFRFLNNGLIIDNDELATFHKFCTEYWVKFHELKMLEKKVNECRKRIRLTNEKEDNDIIEQISKAYLESDYSEEKSPEKRILSLLKKNPLALFSLAKER